MTVTSIQRIVTPAIKACGNITPAGAVGVAIIMIVAADPIGFCDRFFGTIDKLIDTRYSIRVDSERHTVAIGPEVSSWQVVDEWIGEARC